MLRDPDYYENTNTTDSNETANEPSPTATEEAPLLAEEVVAHPPV